MDFNAFLSLLLESDHMSRRFKRMLADELLKRDTKGHTPGDHVVWINDQQALEDFFTLILARSPSSLSPVLKTASTKGWTLGHAIARYKDKQGLQYFLELVQKELPSRAHKHSHTDVVTFEEIVSAKAKNGYTMGHLIAEFQGAEELFYFLETVYAHRPELFTELLDKKLKDGRTITHLVAEYQDAGAFNKYLTYMLKHAPNQFVKLLQAENSLGWNLGFFIAEYQDTKTLEHYFDLIEQYAPKGSLNEILNATTADKGWHLGHLIAQYRDQRCLNFYVQQLITHSPDTLAKLVNMRVEKVNFIDLVRINQPSALGSVVYQLTTSNIPLGNRMFEELQKYKYAVLEHISRLPAGAQVLALKACLDSRTPLGLYFAVKQDFWHRNFNHTHAQLNERIKTMLDRAEVDNAATVQQSAVACKAYEPNFFTTPLSTYQKAPAETIQHTF